MIILAIETSCDESAISIVDAKGGLKSPVFKVLAHTVSSQIELHKEFGGVVPMLAKREHIKNLPPLLDEALRKAKISPAKIDVVAVTYGPGLEPALWAGINFAQELAQKWEKPLIAVNHMEGHIFSPLLANSSKLKAKSLKYPLLSLLISGGHTELVLAEKPLEYKIIGSTRDDAVGEAFDKVARILDLPYPGGPEISRLADKWTTKNEYSYPLPRPMISSKDFDFSFSGLKTAVLYLVKKLGELNDEQKIAIAKEFQDSAIDVLLKKTSGALAKFGAKTLIIGGGVVSNKELKKRFTALVKKEFPKVTLLLPDAKLSTDNATMIALAGYFRLTKGEVSDPANIKAQGNLKLG